MIDENGYLSCSKCYITYEFFDWSFVIDFNLAWNLINNEPYSLKNAYLEWAQEVVISNAYLKKFR